MLRSGIGSVTIPTWGDTTLRKTIPDPNRPIGQLARITNVLPPPKQLAVSEKTIKVTLLLSAASVQFFKRQAAQYGTKYQRMIRKLVDQYAAQHSTDGDGFRR